MFVETLSRRTFRGMAAKGTRPLLGLKGYPHWPMRAFWRIKRVGLDKRQDVLASLFSVGICGSSEALGHRSAFHRRPSELSLCPEDFLSNTPRAWGLASDGAAIQASSPKPRTQTTPRRASTSSAGWPAAGELVC